MTMRLGRARHALSRRTKIVDRMSHVRSGRLAARRFGWLLWLGLLLPIAQLAAATHALSHARTATSSRDDPSSQAHFVHCDLCLTAAAIGGAAPVAEPASLATPVFDASPPRDVVHVAPAVAPALAYRSRAPPVLAS